MKENRLNQIMDIIKCQRKVSVIELVSLLNVSDMTIRRDLQELENQGLLNRYHGGAYIADDPHAPKESESSVQENSSQKDEVAVLSKNYLEKLLNKKAINSVTFSSGSTMLNMIKRIDFDITVPIIADNLPVAEFLGRNPENTLIVLGGVLNFPRKNTIGYLAEQMLDNLSIDCVFMGTSAIDEMGYVYCYSNFEASMLKKMLSAAKHAVVLTDSSKIGRSSLVRVYEMNEKFTLITNKSTPQCYLETYRGMGVEIIVE